MGKTQSWNLKTLTVFLMAGTALAQNTVEMSRPYFFSGPCASQGMWTQQAMNMTQRIREVTQQLRDDPNCKATSNAVQSMLTQVGESLKTAEGGQDQRSNSSRLSSLPKEISALRTFMSDKSGPQQGILQNMMKKAVEYSTLSAEAIATGGAALPAAMTAEGAGLLLNLGQRVQVATYQGLKTFNTVIDSVAQNSQCLSGPQQGQFLAAAASTLASFAMSGQDQIGNELALGISKVANLSREMKYAKVLKELNKAEYLNSMSCLMEITSESYCSARDGYKLYQEMNKQIQEQPADKISQLRMGRDPKSPLAGYYILTQQLPMVNSWLQKVQIGVEPKLGTDALFKNRVLNKITMFYSATNNVLGTFNEKAGYIQNDLKDAVAKKNNIIDLIGILTSSLDNSNTESSSEFFVQSVLPIDIPFRLIGLGKAPAAFFKENSTIDYIKWLQSDENWATVPNSSNPDLLLENIGQNLRKIIDNANDTAIVYYNRFFIFDKSSLYLDALLGTNYNIKDSLISIDQYLAHLQVKIQDLRGNSGYLVSIIETRAKIGRILGKFKKVEALGEKMRQAPKTLSLAVIDEIKAAHMDFINEVYEQFDVLLGKSSWLSNRLSKFVYYDYALTLRNGVDLSPYFKDLYYATGFAAYDKMIAMAAGGPAHVESDLKSALQTNNRNIQALELLFKDNLVAMIREQSLIASQTEKAQAQCGSLRPKDFSTLTKDKQYEINGKIAACVRKFEITPATVYKDMNLKSYMEGYDGLPGESQWAIMKVFKGVKKSFWDLLLGPCVTEGQCLGVHTDKYDMPDVVETLINIKNEKMAFDDESGSAKYLKARLCVQALAFNDLAPFWHLCKDTVLESEFKLPPGSKQLKDSEPNYFRILFGDKAYEQIENPAQNHSQRICAFRDFFRRNQVLYLTMGMQDTTNYKADYSIEENAPVAAPTTTKVKKPTKEQNSEDDSITIESPAPASSEESAPTKPVKVVTKKKA